MKKTKVAIYSGRIPSTTFIEKLILGLPPDKFEILLFGRQNNKVNYPPHIKVYPIKENSGWRFIVFMFYATFFAIKYPSKIKTILQAAKEHEGSKYRYLLRIFHVLKHKPDIFHIQWAKALKYFWVLGAGFDIKLFLSLRGTDVNCADVLEPDSADVYRAKFKTIDKFHAVSEAIKLKATEYGADVNKIKVIYSGMQPEMYEANIDYLKYEDRSIVKLVAVGRNHWIKGYRYLVDALAICKEHGLPIHFTFVGVNLDEDLRFQIHQYGLEENITVLESVPHKDVFKKMQESHLLICSSVEEGISNAVLEAMAVGTAVISTDCGGMAEVVVNNVNGFLVQKRDPEAIFIAIKAFIEKDMHEVRMMVDNAQKTIQEKFNENSMIASFEELYNNI